MRNNTVTLYIKLVHKFVRIYLKASFFVKKKKTSDYKRHILYFWNKSGKKVTIAHD